MNGHEIAKALYQPKKKKKQKRKRIEKVTAPDHWSKEFNPHKQKLKQENSDNPINKQSKPKTP